MTYTSKSPLRMRVWCWRPWLDATIFVGPWAVRVADPRMGGTFGNGSSWWSGWHKWREQPEW